MRSRLPHLVACALLLGACSDEPQPGRPLGSLCGSAEDCTQGACLQGQCLDPEADEDSDGLLNRVESALGTSIFAADSDGVPT